MIIFQSENLILFVVFGWRKQYSLSMIAFSYKRLIDTIFFSLFSGSLFFLLLLFPLIYYSSVPSFYTKYMIQQWVVVSESSLGYVQNVYMFIQWKSSLDKHFPMAEKSHMEDVKQIFAVTYFVGIIASVIFLLVLLIFVFQKKIYLITRWLFRGSSASLLLSFLLILALSIDFTATFTLFHSLLFPQGNWSFNPSSMLISLFPEDFFAAIATRIFLLSVSISLVVLCCSVAWKKIRSIQKNIWM